MIWLKIWHQFYNLIENLTSVWPFDWNYDSRFTIWLEIWQQSYHLPENMTPVLPLTKNLTSALPFDWKSDIRFTIWPKIWYQFFHLIESLTLLRLICILLNYLAYSEQELQNSGKQHLQNSGLTFFNRKQIINIDVYF